MIKSSTKYTPTIGIECHVQLKTKTKLFSAVNNDAREAKPNTLISHIDLGMPGALPVLNEKAVELAIQASLALGTDPQKFSKFDRKHYFYPDLPMGYQITQFYNPIIIGGEINFAVSGQNHKVRIHEAHLEADAGKSTHPVGKEYSLVDLNRAGTPLLEIVTEPDMHTPSEAKACARELYLLMRYADVSEANLYYGNMRFDVNVSLSDTNTLGTRTETKNLNSFKSVEKAIEFEIIRQTELLEKGQKIIQETRGWDDAKQKTFSQRSKEEAHDYRYMPDPDLPPIEISQTAIESIRADMPDLPNDIRTKLNSLNLDSSVVETLIDEIPAGRFISELLQTETNNKLIKKIANWLVSDVQSIISESDMSWEDIDLNPAHFVEVAQLIQDGKISSTTAKIIIADMISSGDAPTKIAESKNLIQVSDEEEISQIVQKVLSDNPNAVADIKSGEAKAIGYLVGQVMKASQGKANPALAQKLINQQINN